MGSTMGDNNSGLNVPLVALQATEHLEGTLHAFSFHQQPGIAKHEDGTLTKPFTPCSDPVHRCMSYVVALACRR